MKLTSKSVTPVMEQEVTITLPVKELAMYFAIIAKNSTASVRTMVREAGFEELADSISNHGKDDLPYEAYLQMKEILRELGVEAE